MSGLQEYLTDAEIAEAAARLNLCSLPGTRRGWNKVAIREGWRQSSLARPRAGREGGGGYEYHLSLLPAALQAALKREYLEAGAAEAAAAEDGAKLPAMAERQRAGCRLDAGLYAVLWPSDQAQPDGGAGELAERAAAGAAAKPGASAPGAE